MGASILAAARHRILLSAAVLLLVACGNTVETPNCEYASENLIDDPAFATLGAPRSKRRWQFSEHAAGKSFEYGASDGILTIDQQGIEPWGMVKQTVNAKPLRGRLVEFTADLKLDLTQPTQPHGFKLGGGLSITAKSNNKLQLSSTMDHQPHMGKHDWFNARLVAPLPRQMNFLQVGFLHQAGGVMQVRNPSLRVVADGCPVTVAPDA
jgi:hypothetical protein